MITAEDCMVVTLPLLQYGLEIMKTVQAIIAWHHHHQLPQKPTNWIHNSLVEIDTYRHAATISQNALWRQSNENRPKYF